MIEITDEMVEAAAQCIAETTGNCWVMCSSGQSCPLCADPQRCPCRDTARDVLTAVAPLIALAEREECAKIPDAFVATADAFEAKGVKHTMAVRTTALGIASLIRGRPHA
jgi:malic enzyme